MYAFDFVKPDSIDAAVAALAKDEAQALGGGQTLIPTLKQRLASPSALVSLTGIAEMKGVCRNDAGQICIGGGTTHATVAAELAELEGEYDVREVSIDLGFLGDLFGVRGDLPAADVSSLCSASPMAHAYFGDLATWCALN